MLLRDQVMCRRWGDCDVGKRAGTKGLYKFAVVWPLEFVGQATQGNSSLGEWKVYLNNGNGTGRHKTFVACREHHVILWENWIQIAAEEVALAEACYAWWEATGL